MALIYNEFPDGGDQCTFHAPPLRPSVKKGFTAMSIFRKILDKLGLRKEKGQSAIIGTAAAAPPDPLSTIPTPASKAVPRAKSNRAAKPGGPAPVSKKRKKGNTERLR
jgi:hypothetical protein